MRFSPKELAQETGKSEGEISKLLAILTLDPDVQKLAREDTTGSITKRHLYAIVKCSPQAQHAAIHSIVRHQLTVEDTDRLVAKERSKAQPAKRGAPVTRLTFRTSQATVVMTFRRKKVNNDDVLRVFDEVKQQLHREPDNRPCHTPGPHPE
jgi:ParB-like chromosome segregation protein Spo0J